MEMRSLVTPCMHSHTVHALPHSACIPTQCMHTVHASNALAETGACIVCATGDRRRDRQGDRRDGLAARSCPRGATHLPPRHRVHRRRAGGQPFTCAYIYIYIHIHSYSPTASSSRAPAARRRSAIHMCIYIHIYTYTHIHIHICIYQGRRAGGVPRMCICIMHCDMCMHAYMHR